MAVELDSARNEEMLGYALVNPDQVHQSSYNPRKHFDPEALQELADSIREHGMLEPIVTRERPGGGYEIIAGERRWRASKLAGSNLIPIRVMEGVDDKKALELALVENLCRKDIDPIEEAEGYQQLRDLGHSVGDIATKIHRSQEAVSNAIRLLKLPEEVREHVRTGKISQSHGKALLPYVQYPKMLEYKLDQALKGKPSKELEKVDPYDYNAKREGIMAEVRTADVGVEAAKKCTSCQARRKNNGDGWLCLDVECYGALRQAKQERQLAAVKAEKGMAEDAEIVRIADLDYNTYEDLQYNCPPGCRKDCEKRVPAIDRNGKLITICLDPKCGKSLRAKKTREENNQRRDELRPQYEALAEAIGAPTETQLRRAAAVVSWEAISGAPLPVLRTAIEHLELDLDAELLGKEDWQDQGRFQRRLDALAALPALTQMRLAAEVKMRRELHDRINTNWGNTRNLDWFLAEPEPAAVEESAPDATPEVNPEPAVDPEPDGDWKKIAIPDMYKVIRVGDKIVRRSIIKEDKEPQLVFDARLAEAVRTVASRHACGDVDLDDGTFILREDLNHEWRFYITQDMIEIGDKLATAWANGAGELYEVKNKCKTEVRLRRLDKSGGYESHPSWPVLAREHHTIVERAEVRS